MFPIRDDQPTFSTAYVNYFIIALNVLVFLLFELPAQTQSTRAMSELIAQFGLVPGHFTDALVGYGRYSIPGTFLTIFTSMFMHRMAAHSRQPVVLVDFWRQRRRLHGPFSLPDFLPDLRSGCGAHRYRD